MDAALKDFSEHFRAIDALRELNELYHNLDKQIREETIITKRQGVDNDDLGGDDSESKTETVVDTLSQGQIKDLINGVIPNLPTHLRKNATQIFGALPDDEDDILVRRESELGGNIKDLIDALYKYLSDNWGHIQHLEKLIIDVLPPSSFDFRHIMKNLSGEYFDYKIIEELNDSLQKFEGGEFKIAIEASGKACEEMLCVFIREFLGKETESNFWPNIQKSYKILNENHGTNHTYWLFWSLIDANHKFRGPAAHITDGKKIPKWMDKYRKSKRKDKDWARLAISCALQAAKEFQKLKEVESVASQTPNP